MIVGTGIDIIEVARVGEKISDKGFREKVFSAAEVAYCETQARKAEHYAARFAAKEAFLKATGKGLLAGSDLCDIEVSNDTFGKPQLLLKGVFAELASDQGWRAIHVSLSHVQQMACAVVVIEGPSIST